MKIYSTRNFIQTLLNVMQYNSEINLQNLDHIIKFILQHISLHKRILNPTEILKMAFGLCVHVINTDIQHDFIYKRFRHKKN